MDEIIAYISIDSNWRLSEGQASIFNACKYVLEPAKCEYWHNIGTFGHWPLAAGRISQNLSQFIRWVNRCRRSLNRDSGGVGTHLDRWWCFHNRLTLFWSAHHHQQHRVEAKTRVYGNLSQHIRTFFGTIQAKAWR